MDQNTNTEVVEFSLADCFVALKKCWKIMLIVAVVVGLLGAAYAYTGETYTTKLVFHVNKGSTSHALLYHLQSEAFVEKLLLDENGLPPREQCDPEDYDEALKLTLEIDELLEKRIELSKEREVFNINLQPYTVELNRITTRYNEVESLLRAYLSEYSDHIAGSEEHQTTIRQYETQLTALKAEKDAYEKDVYQPLLDDQLRMNTEYTMLNRELTEKRQDLADAMDRVLNPWREDEEVQKQVAEIMASVKFEYSDYKSLIPEAESGITEDQKENYTAISQQYVNIYVTSSDSEFVQTVSQTLKEHVGDQIEDFIVQYHGTLEPNCELTTPYAPVTSANGGILMNMVKYGAIGAVASVVVVWLVAICAEIMIMNKIITPKQKKTAKEKQDK